MQLKTRCDECRRREDCDGDCRYIPDDDVISARMDYECYKLDERLGK